MTDDLLPCPFCGARGRIDLGNSTPIRSRDEWVVWCSECEVMMADFQSLESAVAAWNHRTPHPDTVMLDAVERNGWHVDCEPDGEPVCWTVWSWDAARNDWDEHDAPTLRGAIERAIEETK